METPFIFGKIATEKNFTDREKETADLVQNFGVQSYYKKVKCGKI